MRPRARLCGIGAAGLSGPRSGLLECGDVLFPVRCRPHRKRKRQGAKRWRACVATVQCESAELCGVRACGCAGLGAGLRRVCLLSACRAVRPHDSTSAQSDRLALI